MIGKMKKGKNKNKKDISPRIFLVPSIIGVLVFFVLPFICILYFSVINDPINQEFVGMNNYIQLIGNHAFQKAVNNTIFFSIIAVPLAVIFPLFISICLEKVESIRSFLQLCFLSPLVVPTASIILIWQVLFSYTGTANWMLERLGVQPISWLRSKEGMIVVILLFLWKNIGYNIVLYSAALQSIPREIIEVTALDSKWSLRVFFSVKLPFLSPTILFVTILSLTNSFKVFREVYLLTGSYPYDRLYLLQHFMNNKFKSLDYQQISSSAILMCIVMILIFGMLYFLERRLGRDLDNSQGR